MAESYTALLPFDAVFVDLDGVLTSTAKIHAACWKSMFDDFLREHADSSRQPFIPSYIESDYTLYVDGKPRYEGVRSFLESRNIEFPYGSPADDPAAASVCGLGNRKEELVNRAIAAGKVEVYPSHRLIHDGAGMSPDSPGGVTRGGKVWSTDSAPKPILDHAWLLLPGSVTRS